MRRPIPWALLIAAVAAGIFLTRLRSEPHFMDESAYIAQSFYADLLLDGRRDDPAWLDYGAYDLPPLPKYLIGIALRSGGHPRHAPASAFAWYDDPRRRFETEAALRVARVPSVVFGVVGCVAIYAIGRRALGTAGGVVAASLLMASPLYRLHAARAMSDVPAEACILAAMAFGLDAWSRWLDGRGGWRPWLAMVGGAGASLGLAVLSKLNGAIAGMVLGAWALLGVSLTLARWAWSSSRSLSPRERVPGGRVRAVGRSEESSISARTATKPIPDVGVVGDAPSPRPPAGHPLPGGEGSSTADVPRHPRLLPLPIATLLAGLVAFAVFVALNPFLTAHPTRSLRPDQVGPARASFLNRIRAIIAHRASVSTGAQAQFPDDALPSLPDKLKAVAIQGYGRFSPLGPGHSDSTRRFDRDQDWPVVVWLPLVAIGFVVCLVRGRSQAVPTAWAVALAALVAFVAVASFIPLAWDRYYLSIQPGACLLASAALTAPFRRPAGVTPA